MKTVLIAFVLAFTNFLVMPQTISEKEKASVLRMREEEKMARDVYLTLNEKWNQQVFTNIIGSESYHMSQIKLLIDKYKLPDPVAKNNDKRGMSINNNLQKMYDELTTSDKTSMEAAFRAGAKVEEADIKDLRDAIDITVNADIKSTYQYLVQASENHLRAFVRNLKRLGNTYEPIILSKDEFNKIIGDKPGKMGKRRNI